MLNTLLYYLTVMSSSSETMVDLSSLTRIQAETLQLHLAIRKSKINIQDALRTRKNFGISRGTHYRILAQAKKNIRESLFTVAIAVQMGLLKPEEVKKLVSTVSMIPEDMDQEKLSEVLALVKVLVNRIVMS
jgi:hypothetical protein